jgi:GT2 family glycosyltransferase
MDVTTPGIGSATALTVGVCIATHNRRADLERTLAVLAQLDPPPAELLITADGCTDGTVEFVRAHAPHSVLTVNPQARGSTGSRDAMFRMAKSDIILILDDDSHPIETDFLARLPRLFEQNPRLAVANFPQRSDEFSDSLGATDFGPSYFSGTYVNCAAAIRRSVFLELGGYPAEFFIAYDEPDFALRCVSAGWQVRHETSLTIRHHYSGVMRNELRMHHTHARNELWSVLMRCPAPQLFVVAAFRIARQFGHAVQRGPGWVVQEPKWWCAALAGVSRSLAQRHPVPWSCYRAWMQLVRQPLYSEADWLAKFGRGGPSR